jgi:hypothetical protein
MSKPVEEQENEKRWLLEHFIQQEKISKSHLENETYKDSAHKFEYFLDIANKLNAAGYIGVNHNLGQITYELTFRGKVYCDGLRNQILIENNEREQRQNEKKLQEAINNSTLETNSAIKKLGKHQILNMWVIVIITLLGLWAQIYLQKQDLNNQNNEINKLIKENIKVNGFIDSLKLNKKSNQVK